MKSDRTRDYILHEGVVTALKGGQVEVRIERTPSCQGCQAAGLCKAAKGGTSLVTATFQGEEPRVGESVTVEASVGQGLRAALWAYVAPLLLLVAVLGLTVALTHNEGASALAGIGSVAVYYLALHRFGGRLFKGLSFRVRR
ncbi:MAG: SoxR reducing system RseC family protein [Prevotellaceae bacterium]|nr:SoxR reducing system RseC family protein [Prevotellaceae bacterium]